MRASLRILRMKGCNGPAEMLFGNKEYMRLYKYYPSRSSLEIGNEETWMHFHRVYASVDLLPTDAMKEIRLWNCQDTFWIWESVILSKILKFEKKTKINPLLNGHELKQVLVVWVYDSVVESFAVTSSSLSLYAYHSVWSWQSCSHYAYHHQKHTIVNEHGIQSLSALKITITSTEKGK